MASTPRPGQPVRGSKTGRPIMAIYDLLGRAWMMGIIWQLGDGPATFRELQSRCDQISPSLLNTRLKELQTTALVQLGDSGYELTSLGHSLRSHLEPMADWADHWAEFLG